MKDVQHKVNIYDIKNIDQNSCSFRLPESFIEIVKAETVYISDSKNKAKDVIEELGKLYDMKEVIIQALEKQIPKKPREHYNWVDLTEEERQETARWYCKSCDSAVEESYSYCCSCGQKLDWS